VWTRAASLGIYLSLKFKNMGSNGKIPTSIPGLYSTALELNDEKCAICYVELRQQPVVQTTCGHRFCRNCMMRYDFDEVTVSEYLKFRKVSVVYEIPTPVIVSFLS